MDKLNEAELNDEDCIIPSDGEYICFFYLSVH